MKIYFDIEGFMADTGCSSIQAQIVAESYLESPSQPKISHQVRAWNSNGPDLHVSDYLSETPGEGKISIGGFFCLVRFDGLGKGSIENYIWATDEDQAEQLLGPIPEEEEYVAGRLGDSPVYRTNNYQVVGPFDSMEEAVEYIEL